MDEDRRTPLPSLAALCVASFSRLVNSTYLSKQWDRETFERKLPESIRDRVLSQLHYRVLRKIYGESLWHHIPISLSILLGSIKQEEDIYRQYYWSSPPEAKDLFDGQSLMFDIFDDQSMESFWCHKSSDIPSELEGHLVLTEYPTDVRSQKKLPYIDGKNMLPFKEDFMWRFETFTQGHLQYLNWDNILIVGGAVTFPLAHRPPSDYSELANITAELPGIGTPNFFGDIPDEGPDTEQEKVSRKYGAEPSWCKYRQGPTVDEDFLDLYYKHKIGYSDIDIYLYGLNDEDAIKKVEEIYHAVQRATKATVCYACSDSVVLLFGGPGFRPIQIMTNIFKTKEEILLSTDLSISSCGFDGKTVVALPRFVVAMRYNMNVLDSSIRFGTKLKWSRLFKYRNRGMTIALPPHIRIHGHGGLGNPIVTKADLKSGSLDQVLLLMSMAKLVLLKLAFGERFPEPAGSNYFVFGKRWTTGVSSGPYSRIPLKRKTATAFNGSERVNQLLAEMQKNWQLLPLSVDPFDEGKNWNYDYYPVSIHMPKKEVTSALEGRSYKVHDPISPEEHLEDVQTRAYAASPFQCFHMDAVVKKASLAPTYADINTALARVEYPLQYHTLTIPDFWSFSKQPFYSETLDLCGHSWSFQFEILEEKHYIFFRLKWLGRIEQTNEASVYLGPNLFVNFLVQFITPLTKESQVEIYPIGAPPSVSYDGSCILSPSRTEYLGMLLGSHLIQRHAIGENDTAKIRLAVQVMEIINPAMQF